MVADQTNDPSVVSISWGWDENQPFLVFDLVDSSAIDHIGDSFFGPRRNSASPSASRLAMADQKRRSMMAGRT